MDANRRPTAPFVALAASVLEKEGFVVRERDSVTSMRPRRERSSRRSFCARIAFVYARRATERGRIGSISSLFPALASGDQGDALARRGERRAAKARLRLRQPAAERAARRGAGMGRVSAACARGLDSRPLAAKVAAGRTAPAHIRVRVWSARRRRASI